MKILRSAEEKEKSRHEFAQPLFAIRPICRTVYTKIYIFRASFAIPFTRTARRVRRRATTALYATRLENYLGNYIIS